MAVRFEMLCERAYELLGIRYHSRRLASWEETLAYFATPYTIHFDDTMAYGSHHFLTAFKFQCAARETFLFGEKVFDVPGVKKCLDRIHLLTADAYSRNLHPTVLGDRVAILLTLEEWGKASARFCYRVVDALGNRISAGFQTLICADAVSGDPMPMPNPLQDAMNAMREIEEAPSRESFRDRVLSGGSKLDTLFQKAEIDAALQFLAKRYPAPEVIGRSSASADSAVDAPRPTSPMTDESVNVRESMNVPAESVGQPVPQVEAWVFAGQGALDPHLLSARINAYRKQVPSAKGELERCAAMASEILGGDCEAVFSGSPDACRKAMDAAPDLSQFAIHLQNVLGALLWKNLGHRPGMLIGHSFGEIAAMCVGGCFDLTSSIRVVGTRVQAIAQFAPPGGGLMVVSMDRHRVETEASLRGLNQISIAGRNHDKQTVASGPIDQLEILKDYFKSIQISAMAIPSPTSYHHPCLKRAAAHWLGQLRQINFMRPQHPIYSPIGRRFLSADEDFASVLSSQLLRPFDLQGGLVDAMKAGVTEFVDCGSTGSLQRLISTALPGGTRVSRAETEVSRVKNSGLPSMTGPQTPPTVVGGINGKHARTDHLPKLSASTDRDQFTVPNVAIVGQGCLMPGGANSPEQLLAAINEQRMGIVDQRDFDERWSDDFYSEDLMPDRSTSHLSGRVRDEDITVPKGIAPEIFEGFTRTQRLLCIALAPCVDAVRDAERVVCLIGATADGFEDQDEVSSLRYAGIDPTNPYVDSRMNTARTASSQPHDAVQEVFDRIIRPGLQVTLVDAACASSLYAVALGMRVLETEQADAVIAGGVFCPGPGNSCLFSQFHGTTSTGCRPYDAGADGVVFSEGSALVALRRYRDAEKLNLATHAIVRGAGLSSDGRSPSANVPQTEGQLLSLKRCYANYGVDPGSIHAIEGHGTSTPVGDTTELETLRRFYEKHFDAPIPVHSLKGLLGHAGWAAGTASVIAACQYLRTKTFPIQAGFSTSSEALTKCDGTLTVAQQPVQLPENSCRIAIDGFGFGGANAHLVLEQATPQSPQTTTVFREPPNGQRQSGDPTSDGELVFVAGAQIEPTLRTQLGMRFDRETISLPAGHIVLPELNEDMDVSQTLAVILSRKIVDQIPAFDDSLRQETSLILALSGKTERGVEATLRIMAERFQRNLQGNAQLHQMLDAAHNRARPSGPYTLQCMMPNVAAGRAALLLNLNGPNFVVDAGHNSWEAAISSAEMLLNPGGSTQLVVLAAMAASSRQVPEEIQTAEGPAAEASDEFAFAFGITTRQLARARGMHVIGSVRTILEESESLQEESSPVGTTHRKVQMVAGKLSAIGQSAVAEPDSTTYAEAKPESISPTSNGKPSPAIECPIHTPVWIEQPLQSDAATAPRLARRTLILCPAHRELTSELLQTLPQITSDFNLGLVEPKAGEHDLNPSLAFNIDMSSPQSIFSALSRIAKQEFELILAVDSIHSWQLPESLENVCNNSLCEFTFLVAQQHAQQLRAGTMELWSLFQDGWNGNAHPGSGAIAGLLKSIHRELPKARCSTLVTRGLSLADGLACLAREKGAQHNEPEIAYNHSTRLVRRLRPALLKDGNSSLVELDRHSVVVASGGARGVTAVMLESIAHDFGCTIVALGRSPLKQGPEGKDSEAIEQEFYKRFVSENPGVPAAEMKQQFELARARWEAHQTMQRLSDAGSTVEYLEADVANPEHVARAIDQIADRYGRIDLLIHGAGVQASKQLKDRSLEDFRKTYSVKVAGLRNLVQCCNQRLNQTPNVHVLTSAYSIFGNDGQHDYGAANETLDRLCGLTQLDQTTSWSSIAWLAWDGIGMTRGSEYRALAKQRSLSGVTPEIGQSLFRQVLTGKTDSAINVPVSPAEHVKYDLRTIPAAPRETLQDSTIRSNEPHQILEMPVELSSIECLPFHLIRGIPTLPGAWILDQFVRAAMQTAQNAEQVSAVRVEELAFTRFVRSAQGKEPNLRVVAEVIHDSVYLSLLTDLLHPTGATLSKDVICASAKLQFSTETSRPPKSTGETSLSFRLPANGTIFDPYCDQSGNQVALSGPFNCLRDVRMSSEGRRARFAPDTSCRWNGEIPALLLDAAWRVGAMYSPVDPKALFVPVHIGRLFIPVGMQANSVDAQNWEIRSTQPTVDGDGVRWLRTEVLDITGKPRLVVENAFATRLE